MGMTDQVIRELGRLKEASSLDDIGTVVDEFRAGRVTEDAAIETIARLVRRHKVEQPVYQKPWG